MIKKNEMLPSLKTKQNEIQKLSHKQLRHLPEKFAQITILFGKVYQQLRYQIVHSWFISLFFREMSSLRNGEKPKFN